MRPSREPTRRSLFEATRPAFQATDIGARAGGHKVAPLTRVGLKSGDLPLRRHPPAALFRGGSVVTPSAGLPARSAASAPAQPRPPAPCPTTPHRPHTSPTA